MTPEEARAWWTPQSLLVVGVSRTRVAQGNLFLRRQRQFGFSGPIYVVHPEGGEIEGQPVWRSPREVPGPVDYGFVAVPARAALDVVRACAGRVRILQIMTSGFQELGPDGEALQAELVRTARAGGTRIVGPNCFGTYAPAGRLTMLPEASPQAGSAAFVAQSGGLSCEVMALGTALGLRFRVVAALGNCADIDTTEVLEFLLDDAETKVIGLYLETVHRPRVFRQLLARAEGQKPVVLLKGGSGADGQRAARTHTGALAVDHRVLRGLAEQFGAAWVDDPEDLVRVLLLHQWADEIGAVGSQPLRVALIGPGGGLGVLTVDDFNRRGLAVPAFSPDLQRRLHEAGLPAEGSGLVNPVDVSVMTQSSRDRGLWGRLLRAVAAAGEVDWIVAHVHLPNLFALTPNPDDILAGFVEGLASVGREAARPPGLLAVVRAPAEGRFAGHVDAVRTALAVHRIPVFERLADAGRALAGWAGFAGHRARLRSGGTGEPGQYEEA